MIRRLARALLSRQGENAQGRTGSSEGIDCVPMKTLFGAMLFAFVIGLAILCCFAPWTSTPAGSDAAHNSLGYAAIWSHQYAAVPGARVDLGAFAMLAGVVFFFAVVIGASAYFFRNKRGAEREDV
jgi:hypothetical protein